MTGTGVTWLAHDWHWGHVVSTWLALGSHGFFFPALSSPVVNECDVNNGGCERSCHDTSNGFFCRCQYGYVLDPSNRRSCIGEEGGRREGSRKKKRGKEEKGRREVDVSSVEQQIVVASVWNWNKPNRRVSTWYPESWSSRLFMNH